MAEKVRFSPRYDTWQGGARAIRSDQIDKGRKGQYLCTEGAVGIYEAGMEETLFVFEIGVEDGTTDETLECSDSVSEIGRLLCLCRLADSALFGTKSDERSMGG